MVDDHDRAGLHPWLLLGCLVAQGKERTVTDTTWAGATEPLRRKLKTASIAGMGYQFTPIGIKALESLLTEMATRLDKAVEMQLAKGPDRD